VVALPAHVAALGLTFYTGKLLPASYRGGLVVAYHGSSYRTQPSGYKVVYIPVQGTRAGQPRDLVTGWLTSATSYVFWGRPVGLLVAADGSLLISDDRAGVIYRLAAAGR
jgi:glucose/arabinose dehydrogenase